MDGDGNDHHPEVVLAPETCEVIVSYAPERKAPGEAFLSSSGMEMTGANAGCTRLYLRPLSCCSSPFPTPDQGMWATKAGQGENRPRRHTFDRPSRAHRAWRPVHCRTGSREHPQLLLRPVWMLKNFASKRCLTGPCPRVGFSVPGQTGTNPKPPQ